MSDDINQRWTMDGADEFVAQLRRIAAEAEKTAQTVQSSSTTAAVGFNALNAATVDLHAAFRELASLAGAAASPITRILSSLGGLTSGFSAVGAAVIGVTAGLGALAKQGADAADEIRDGAIRVGTSAENYSTLRFALQQSGAGAEGFERAMGRVFEASNQADKAGDEAAKGADKLEGAVQKMAASQNQIADLFRKKNVDLADEQRRSAQEIADLTRRKGTAEEEIQFQTARRIEDIQRQSTRALNDIIRKRNEDNRAALDAFNKHLEESTQKAFVGGDAFNKLGVRLKGANGTIRDTAEIFKDVADQVSKIEDPTARSAKAIELFSRRAGPKLVEALSLGRKGIEELEAEATKLGLRFSKEQTEIGDNFNDAMAKLSGTLAATAQKIGLLFAPAFTAIAEGLAATFGDLQTPILNALKPIAADLKNLFSGNLGAVQSQFLLGLRDVAVVVGAAFKVLGTVVASVMQTMGAAFQGFADIINLIFGTKFTAVDIPAFIIAIKLAASAVGVLTTAFVALRAAALANPLVAIATAITLIAATVIANWEPIVKFFSDLLDSFTTLGLRMQRAGQDMGGIFGGLVKIVGDNIAAIQKLLTGDTAGALEEWKTMWKDALTFIFVTLFDAAVELATQKLSDLSTFMIKKFGEIGTAIADILKSAFGGGGAPSGGGASVKGARRGGLIRGFGSGTSDSNLRRVSHGEYIVNALATRTFLPLLEAINRGLAPRVLKPPGFALGGLVGAAQRSLLPRRSSMPGSAAPLGAAGGGRPFTLVLDGRSFGGMTAADDTVGELVQFARQAKMRSLGRKPSYYGNG